MRNLVLLIGRVLMSAIFIQAGFSKLMNVAGTIGYFQSIGLPMPSLAIWPVVALEILGGLAILLGYRISLAAGLLALFSLAAAAAGHSDFSDLMHFQAFMKDMAIAGGLLFAAAFGAGSWSLDARR